MVATHFLEILVLGENLQTVAEMFFTRNTSKYQQLLQQTPSLIKLNYV